MIEVKNLTKQFEEIVAVDNINFKIGVGEITGFLGPNGAGKSTTLKMLTNYLKPTSGEILINNIKLQDYDYDIRKDIGYLPELNPLYHELLVYDYLKYIAELKEIEKKQIQDRIVYVAERCGIKERLAQTIGTLSKGLKQRVGLAQAILNDPKILILDEPTVGLDPNQIIEIRGLISELGKNKTVILSSHIIQEIQAICQRILIIHKGRLVINSTKAELLEKYEGSKGLEEIFARVTSEG
jgi:ABC-2 type transport system ATP-binding protein